MGVKNILSLPFLAAQSMGASFNSAAIRLHRASGSEIQLVFTGAPVGTFKLQSSTDVTYDSASIVNWDDIPGSSQVISAAGSHTWKLNERRKWVRVVYTVSSGTGFCDGTYFAVEDY